MSKPTIHVFGGANGIGRWFVERVFSNRVGTINVYDTDAVALAKCGNTGIKQLVQQNQDYADLNLQILEGDWLIFAVPVHILSDVVKQVCRYACRGSLLVDFSSVKEGPLGVITALAPNGVEILGVHPLFGPLIPSPVGQLIALTPVTGQGPLSKQFKRTLEHAGLITSFIEAEDHDNAMAYVQALTHFAYLAFSKAVVMGGKTFSELLRLRTPPFHFLSAFAGRVLAGSPATYVNIQRTSAAAKVRKLMISAAQELDQAFQAENITTGINAFEEIRKPLSGSEIQQCTAVSRLATDTLERFERQLHELKDSSAIVFFKASDSGMLHLGKIDEIRPDAVVITETFKKIQTESGIKFAIPLNKLAELNYRKIGISFGNGTKNLFLKRKIEFLGGAAQEQWICSNLLLIVHFGTFEKSGSFEPEALEALIPQVIPGVFDFTFVEAYHRRGNVEKLTFKMTLRPDFDRNLVHKQIQDFIAIFTSRYAS